MNPSEAGLAKIDWFTAIWIPISKKELQSGSLPGGTVGEISAAVLSGWRWRGGNIIELVVVVRLEMSVPIVGDNTGRTPMCGWMDGSQPWSLSVA